MVRGELVSLETMVGLPLGGLPRRMDAGAGIALVCDRTCVSVSAARVVGGITLTCAPHASLSTQRQFNQDQQQKVTLQAQCTC